MTRLLTSVSLTPVAAQPEGDVLVDRQVGEQGVVLEDRVDVALVGRQPGHVLARSSIRPEVGCSKPPIMRRVVVLPQPDGPRRLKNSPVTTSRSMWSTANASPIRLGDLDQPDVDVSHRWRTLLQRRGPSWRSGRSDALRGRSQRAPSRRLPTLRTIGACRRGVKYDEPDAGSAGSACEIRRSHGVVARRFAGLCRPVASEPGRRPSRGPDASLPFAAGRGTMGGGSCTGQNDPTRRTGANPTR